MPYVNCPECGVRAFALAPWSTVDRCPLCEAALTVPRVSVAADRTEHDSPRASVGTPGSAVNQPGDDSDQAIRISG